MNARQRNILLRLKYGQDGHLAVIELAPLMKAAASEIRLLHGMIKRIHGVKEAGGELNAAIDDVAKSVGIV